MRLILRRIVFELLPTVVVATFVVFFLVQLIPGDTAARIAGDSPTVEQLERIRQRLGLDEPLLVQYWNWLTDAVRFDFGSSFISGEPVTESLGRTWGVTAQIVVCGMVLALAVGIPMGVLAASHPDGLADRLITRLASIGVAIPSFWLGLLLVSFLALHLGWFPATGAVPLTQDPLSSLQATILPAIAVGVVPAATITRQLRAAMVETLGSDYIRTLRAKGTREGSILWKHGLRNSAIPVVTVAALSFNHALGATVIVEAVFGISGMGHLIVSAAQARDYPIVQGVVLFMTIAVLLVNLLVDLSYRLIDPRVSRA